MSQPARTREGKFELVVRNATHFFNLLCFTYHYVEIEQQVLEFQKKAAQNAANGDGEDDEGRISLSKANMDSDIYGDSRMQNEYHSSIPAGDDADYDVCVTFMLCKSLFTYIFIFLG